MKDSIYMKNKIIVLVSVLLIGIGAVTTLSLIRQQPQGKMRPDWRDRGLIASTAKNAKEKVINKTSVYPPHVSYVDGLASMDEALSYYSAVIAQPITKHTQISKDGEEIITWYKFKILENLSDKVCSRCLPADELPSEMLPLNSDEIIVNKHGGTVSLDGVEVTMPTPSYPDFETSEKYLLFLEIDPTRQFGKIMVGPAGTFTVKPNGDIVPINEKDHPLKKIIKEQYKSSIKELKDYTKGRKTS